MNMRTTITLLITLFFSFVTYAEVSLTEKNALVKLYKSTHGDQWASKRDFNKPVATWQGVVVVNDKVVAIDLSDNNLVGTIPSQISDLVNLESLILFKNKIEGSLPKSIGLMKSLKVLNVSFNKLTGSIPMELTKLPALTEISFYE